MNNWFLDKNSDKKTVRNQIREYAFGIRKLREKSKGWQEFLDIVKDANESSAEDVKRRENIHGKSLEEILHDKLDDGSSTQKSQDCLQEIKKNFEDGEIILIIAIDKIRRNLRTSIDGENELDGDKLPMFALEVNEFKTKKDETIVISSTYPFDLDDLIDKKEERRTTNNQKSFDDIYSKTILSEEQITIPIRSASVSLSFTISPLLKNELAFTPCILLALYKLTSPYCLLLYTTCDLP